MRGRIEHSSDEALANFARLAISHTRFLQGMSDHLAFLPATQVGQRFSWRPQMIGTANMQPRWRRTAGTLGSRAAFATTLAVTTGIPQIADDLLHCPSRPSRATNGLMHRNKKPSLDDLVGGSGLPLDIGYFDTMGIEPPFRWLVRILRLQSLVTLP